MEYGREMDDRAERRAERLLIVRRWCEIRSSAWEEAMEERSERAMSFSEGAENSLSEVRTEVRAFAIGFNSGSSELGFASDGLLGGGFGGGSSAAIELSESLSDSLIIEVSSCMTTSVPGLVRMTCTEIPGY